MPDDQFCLRWNNHHPNLIAMFSSLLQNDQMVDVTLISENREIHAHKIVLSACSPFFQNIFLRNSCKHPVIVLTGIKYSHMKSLVEFIYNGEVNIYQENLTELLRIANILKIRGLDEMPPSTSSQSNQIDNDNNDNTDEECSKDKKFIVEHPFFSTTKDKSLPSTSDLAAAIAAESTIKSSKKRKSVSFSDTPEFVCDQRQLNVDSSALYAEFGESGSSSSSSGNGKRKLRSLTDICSITKIGKQSKEATASASASNTIDDDDSFEQANKNQQLVVTINPNTTYSSNESINTDSQMMGNDCVSPLSSSVQPKTQQQQRSASISRKMIRKNENFLRALEAVRDEGIGFCKAAKIHGVNNRTLWLEYQKRGYPMKNARKKSQ